jgi:hypothetical protein
VFCSHACRQWDWVGRQRARELQLNEHELIVTKEQLDQIHDELYVLACAVDDVERDRLAAGAKPTVKELQGMLEWLLDSARPIRNRELGAQRP